MDFDIAAIHPIVVHFAIALSLVGVAFRCATVVRWFSPRTWQRLEFTHPAATILLIVGAVASVLAVESGFDAHGPAEHIPGAGALVHDHGTWGERVRNLLVLVAVAEVAAWIFRTRELAQRIATAVSIALGLGAAAAMIKAADQGGDLVYRHAGGVGTRSGDARDVERLLLAGLFHQAERDRDAKRPEAAARLVHEMAQRFPGRMDVQILRARSLLEDLNDPKAALEHLDSLRPPVEDKRARVRISLLRIDAFEADGQIDAAAKTLRSSLKEFPESRWLPRRAERFRGEHPGVPL